MSIDNRNKTDQLDIIRMAREAGGALSCIAEPLEHPWKFSRAELERFAALVTEATKANVYQAIRDAETPATQLTLGQQQMIKEVLK